MTLISMICPRRVPHGERDHRKSTVRDAPVALDFRPILKVARTQGGQAVGFVRTRFGVVGYFVDVDACEGNVDYMREDDLVVEILAVDADPMPRRGGRRHYIRCPSCDRRCLVLYVAPLSPHRLGCRVCLDLRYESQRQCAETRLATKSRKIRAKLSGDTSLLTNFPERPPGLHRRTYMKICLEAEAVEQSLAMALLKRSGGR